MTTPRHALAPALLAAVFAVAGCGMMPSSSPSSSPAPAARPMMVGDTMTATLSGAAQVPPNASRGTGTGTVRLDGSTLSWNVSYQGLSGPVTGAHFHGPAAETANAPVVVPFAGSLASPIIGTATLTAAQIADLKAGRWYINLHTAANPAGEIRGHVK